MSKRDEAPLKISPPSPYQGEGLPAKAWQAGDKGDRVIEASRYKVIDFPSNDVTRLIEVKS